MRPHPHSIRIVAAAAGLIAATLASEARADEYPTIIVAPAWSFRLPYQIIGVGVHGNVFLDGIVNAGGTYQYGLHPGEADDDEASASHFFEIYVGYPISWSGAGTAMVSEGTTTDSKTSTTTYHEEERSTSSFLALEVALSSGSRLFRARGLDPTTGALESTALLPKERHQLIYPAAGLRYSRAFVGEDRASTAIWVHAVGPAAGVPDTPSGGKLYVGDPTDYDSAEHETLPVGVKGGVDWTIFANGLATLLIEVGYMPAGGPVYVGFGNSFPFWF